MINKYRILSILFVSLFLSSTLAIGVGMMSVPQGAYSNTDQGAVPAGYPSTDLDNRNSPVSILVYTEFADTTTPAPYNEFRNTMDSIKATYGEQFRYDNLTSYSELTTSLSEYDILLLPEQEILSEENLTSIASAWTSPLASFVSNGGIVVALDAYGGAMSVPTIQILNETGLMTVYDPVYGDGWTNTLVNTSDALARGVEGSWPAPDGSVHFDTPDATIVVDDGTHAVVAHKIIGAGHVVLLGFDLWESDANCDALLANAIRLHRHVVFDNSHSNLGSVVNGYSLFAEDLANNGFAVSGMNTFDADYLQAADVLVIPSADYHSGEYTTSDLDVIEAFVSSGGGLFILSDYAAWGNVTDPVNERFGFVRNKTMVLHDSDDFNGAASGYAVIYSGSENIINHSATLKVNSLETWSGTGLESMPATAVPLIVTDSDGTSTYDSWLSTNGTVFAAATTHGQGRVVFIGDSNLFGDSDLDTDGTEAYLDTDSEMLGVNTIRWLSAAGIEEKVVLFDASHGYNFHVTASYYGFANLLTENGFTVYWMSTFYESLMDRCDVFVIEDGSTNYTISELDTIEYFVEDGGSIFLIGGNDANGEQADYVGNRFGLDLNNTGYLFDSDDYILLSGYIAYNASNFGSHPIMNGIEVVESYMATGFDSIGSADALITTDADDTCTWSDGGVANGLPILVAKEHNKGRLVFLGDYRFPRYNADTDGDGTSSLYDADNPLLLLNIFHWLAEGRAPTVEVIFPNGGEVLNGTELVTWDANDLDDDSLTFDVLYSNNSGSDWISLATGLTVLEYEWNTTLHDDGSEYLIRVIVSDGEYSVTDDSDSAFSIDNVADTTTGNGFGDWDITTIIIIIVAGGVVIIIIIIIMKKKK